VFYGNMYASINMSQHNGMDSTKIKYMQTQHL